MAENKYKVGIFVDVKSAFDSVNHQLMFETLSNQGFDSVFIKTVALIYEFSRVND